MQRQRTTRCRPAGAPEQWLWLLLLLLVVIIALLLAAGGGAAIVGGAAATAAAGARCRRERLSPHIVVDGLNATHALYPHEAVTTESITRMVDTLAPLLKQRHTGRVMVVVKDRDSAARTAATGDAYAEAARRNGVYLVTAELYRDSAQSRAHAARGRDDFTAAVLAARWKCPVLTEDRMDDFDEFRASISPYATWEYAYWRHLPARDYIDPRSPAYARLRRPCRVGYAEYGIKGGMPEEGM